MITHGHEPGSEVIGMAAMAACNQLDNLRAGRYADLVYASLNDIARAALESLMEQQKYTYQSDFARKYLAQGYREMVGALLQQRFGELPVEVQARLDAADADTLSAWGRRVLTAASLADVFAPESK